MTNGLHKAKDEQCMGVMAVVGDTIYFCNREPKYRCLTCGKAYCKDCRCSCGVNND